MMRESGLFQCGLKSVSGALVFLEGARGISYGEMVEVIGGDGRVRPGRVLIASREAVAIEVYQGTEGLSQPFAYEVTVLRNTKYPDIGLADMVNTVARIGIKTKDPGPEMWFCRAGVIDHFEELSVTTKFRVRHYHTYKARIVPALNMMVRQRFFRIFENTTVTGILDTVLASVPYLNGNPKAYNLDDLDCIEWPYLDHRIQFGEDTYAFLVRLMAEFGIWYYYDFSLLSSEQVKSTKTALACSPLVLCGSMALAGRDPFRSCDRLSSPVAVNGSPAENEVGGINRSYNPGIGYFEIGDFNPLKPSAPRSGKAGTRPAEDSHNKNWSAHFPSSLDRQKDADPAAKFLLDQSRDAVTMIAGSAINTTFAAGRSFKISSDVDDPDETGREFVISTLSLHGYDNSIGGQVGAGIVSFLNGWIWEPIKGIALDVINPICQAVGGKPLDDPGTAGNVSLSLAAGGLNNMWKNQIQLDAQWTMFNKANPNWQSGAKVISAGQTGYVGEPTNLGAATYFEAGAISAITGAIGTAAATFGKPLSEVWQMADRFGDGSNFANSFTALPKFITEPPLPKVPRVTVPGPHLAIVIGQDGAVKRDGNNKGDDITGIYADDLGRVRIRFPWDPGPPSDKTKASPPAATLTPPLAYGENTCWVRVSQPWASRGYGAQFLPRIGDEVIVQFLDGDPDRPVVTGRLYNADHGYANMPFPKDRKADPASVTIPEGYLLNPSPPTSSKFTRSGVKTSTVKNGEAVPGKFHLLRFDDDADYNQVLLRSEDRLDVTALGSRYETIHADRHLTVGGKKLTPPRQIWGDYIAKIFRNYHLHVGDPDFPTLSGNRYTRIEQNDETAVMGDRNHAVAGNWSLVVGDPAQPFSTGQATIDTSAAMGTIVLNAGTNLTLSVGASSIVITPVGISITAPAIFLVSPVLLSTMPLVPMGAISLPPAPPIGPTVEPPQDPTRADDGDTHPPKPPPKGN